MPSLAGFRWNPIVTVLNPTSAMVEASQASVTENVEEKLSLKWLRSKLDVVKRAETPTEPSGRNHT